MAALAANATALVERPPDPQAPQVVNAAVVFSGGLLAMNSRGHGTAGSRGRIQPWTAAAFKVPYGISQVKATGDTAATPIVTAQTKLHDTVLEAVTVTGSTGLLDANRWVFLTTDNPAVFTLTPTHPDLPLGIVLRWITGTTCDVLVFGLTTQIAIAAGGGVFENVLLASLGCTGAAGNMQTGIEMRGHGRILGVYGIVDVKCTDADVDMSINLEFDGTNVTGGVVNWLFSDAIGAKKAGTAVTDDGGNEFHDGTLLDIEVVYNAAGTATDIGRCNLFALVLHELGI